MCQRQTLIKPGPSFSLQGEQLLGLLNPPESVPANRNKSPPILWQSRRSEVGGDQDILFDGAAESSDPAHLIHRRTDNRKVEPVLAPDVPVEDLADVQAQVGVRDRQRARRVRFVDQVKAREQLFGDESRIEQNPGLQALAAA